MATTASAATTTTKQEKDTTPSSPDYGSCDDNNRCSGAALEEKNKKKENPLLPKTFDDNENATTTTEKPPTTIRRRMWRAPWMAALVFFYVFFFLWAFLVVVQRYWIKQAFGVALPGLDSSIFRKHTMRLHLTLGALALLFVPIQMITPLTSTWNNNNDRTKGGAASSTTSAPTTTTTDNTSNNNNNHPTTKNNRMRRLHRYSGRLYTVCAILSYVCGQWFIVLKEFRLVGGYNMGIAFSLSGFAIAYFAFMAWETAPSREKKDDGGNTLCYTIEDHRNYAIRSVSQVIAPLLYRIWYVLLMVSGLYRTPYLNHGDPRGTDLRCNDEGVCSDYLRAFDALWCWLYWMGAWAVAEIVIVCLPSSNDIAAPSSDHKDLTKPSLLLRAAAQQRPGEEDDDRQSNNSAGSLAATTEEDDDGTSLEDEEDDNTLEEKEPLMLQQPGGTSAKKKGTASQGKRTTKILVLDVMGCLLAMLSAAVAIPIVARVVVSVVGKTEAKR